MAERVLSVETIECPECGFHQKAEVTQNGVMPFATYIKVCEKCEYIIMESDWKVVNDLGGWHMNILQSIYSIRYGMFFNAAQK